eukprot:g5886.t1
MIGVSASLGEQPAPDERAPAMAMAMAAGRPQQEGSVPSPFATRIGDATVSFAVTGTESAPSAEDGGKLPPKVLEKTNAALEALQEAYREKLLQNYERTSGEDDALALGLRATPSAERLLSEFATPSRSQENEKPTPAAEPEVAATVRRPGNVNLFETKRADTKADLRKERIKIKVPLVVGVSASKAKPGAKPKLNALPQATATLETAIVQNSPATPTAGSAPSTRGGEEMVAAVKQHRSTSTSAVGGGSATSASVSSNTGSASSNSKAATTSLVTSVELAAGEKAAQEKKWETATASFALGMDTTPPSKAAAAALALQNKNKNDGMNYKAAVSTGALEDNKSKRTPPTSITTSVSLNVDAPTASSRSPPTDAELEAELSKIKQEYEDFKNKLQEQNDQLVSEFQSTAAKRITALAGQWMPQAGGFPSLEPESSGKKPEGQVALLEISKNGSDMPVPSSQPQVEQEHLVPSIKPNAAAPPLETNQAAASLDLKNLLAKNKKELHQDGAQGNAAGAETATGGTSLVVAQGIEVGALVGAVGKVSSESSPAAASTLQASATEPDAAGGPLQASGTVAPATHPVATVAPTLPTEDPFAPHFHLENEGADILIAGKMEIKVVDLPALMQNRTAEIGVAKLFQELFDSPLYDLKFRIEPAVPVPESLPPDSAALPGGVALLQMQGPAKRKRLAATLLQQKAKKEKNASRSKKAEGEAKGKAARSEAEEDAVDAEILFEFRVKSVPPEIQNLLQSGEIAAAWDSLRGLGGISQVTDVSLKVHESWPTWNQTVFLPAGPPSYTTFLSDVGVDWRPKTCLTPTYNSLTVYAKQHVLDCVVDFFQTAYFCSQHTCLGLWQECSYDCAANPMCQGFNYNGRLCRHVIAASPSPSGPGGGESQETETSEQAAPSTFSFGQGMTMCGTAATPIISEGCMNWCEKPPPTSVGAAP